MYIPHSSPQDPTVIVVIITTMYNLDFVNSAEDQNRALHLIGKCSTTKLLLQPADDSANIVYAYLQKKPHKIKIQVLQYFG